MSLKRIIFKVILPFLVVFAGIAIMTTLMSKRPAPERKEIKSPGALVNVITVKRRDYQVTVKGTGTVQPLRKITVIPQVSGEVRYISPALLAGGFVSKGELLFEIDDSDYRLALIQAESSMSKAELELVKMESNRRIARSEWERMHGSDGKEAGPLVLYEPQIKSAQAALNSSAAAVEQARLKLERTKVYAPFDSIINSEDLDVGQYLKAGSTAAVLSGTGAAEVIVPMPADKLRWLDIPRYGRDMTGSEATVELRVGGVLYQWHGRVVRTLGEVDTRSRMMRLVVRVEDPYGILERQNGRPALLSGAFVNVRFKGRRLSGVYLVPRAAFREKSTVWIVDSEDKLEIRGVTTVRKERDEIIVGEGLSEGERIILSTIAGAADGMKLRPVEEGAEQ